MTVQVISVCRDFVFAKFRTELVYCADKVFRCSVDGFAVDSGGVVRVGEPVAPKAKVDGSKPPQWCLAGRT